eukprot:9129352-Pyramimonas_sp.AAC.1
MNARCADIYYSHRAEERCGWRPAARVARSTASRLGPARPCWALRDVACKERNAGAASVAVCRTPRASCEVSPD